MLVRIRLSAFSLTLLASAFGQAQTPVEQSPPPVAPLPEPVQSAPAAAVAQPPRESELEELDQRLRIFERNVELDQEKAAERAKEAAKIEIGKGGFQFKSNNGDFLFRPRMLVQADSRTFFGDDSSPLTNTFLVRRVRPIIDATLWGWIDARITPDFGDGKVVLYDAYTDLKFAPWLKLRVGKFKPPIGLERLQSAANLLFIERGHPTSLVPNRDVGAQIHGDIDGGTLQYAVGVFNGVPDGGNGDGDNNDNKEYVGRVFAHPLRPLDVPELKNLGIGFAASFGKQRGLAATPNLPSFKTPAQQTFFSFPSDASKPVTTVIARNDHYRLAPQLYWYANSFGLLGEYVYSNQRVLRDSETYEVASQAFQIAASYVVTGEDASYEGVAPKHPFNITNGEWGAPELAARYHSLNTDAAVFSSVADVNKSARVANSWGVGVNWHLAKGNRLAVNFERTEFKGGAAGDANRETENAVLARAQTSF